MLRPYTFVGDVELATDEIAALKTSEILRFAQDDTQLGSWNGVGNENGEPWAPRFYFAVSSRKRRET